MEPKLSASLLILRAAARHFEILMLQRCRTAAFGGTYSFPGGVLEPDDADPRWNSLTQVSPAKVPATSYSAEVDLTVLKLTALRETYEETGLSLGLELKSSQQYAAACFSENLVPPLHKLNYFTRFITPKVFQPRFDTVFFTCLAEEESVVLNVKESDGYAWDLPQVFLRKFEAKELKLAPPQVYMLLLLEKYGSAVLRPGWSTIPLLGQPIRDPEAPKELRTVAFTGDFRHEYPAKGNFRHAVILQPPTICIDEGWLQAFEDP